VEGYEKHTWHLLMLRASAVMHMEFPLQRIKNTVFSPFLKEKRALQNFLWPFHEENKLFSNFLPLLFYTG
jgi:hypothetical protein